MTRPLSMINDEGLWSISSEQTKVLSLRIYFQSARAWHDPSSAHNLDYILKRLEVLIQSIKTKEKIIFNMDIKK